MGVCGIHECVWCMYDIVWCVWYLCSVNELCGMVCCDVILTSLSPIFMWSVVCRVCDIYEVSMWHVCACVYEIYMVYTWYVVSMVCGMCEECMCMKYVCNVCEGDTVRVWCIRGMWGVLHGFNMCVVSGVYVLSAWCV